MNNQPIDPATNPHNLDHIAYTLVYWANGVACGMSNDWTQVELFIPPNYVRGMVFNRDQQFILNNTCQLIERAYNKGVSDFKAEFRQFIGITS